MRFSTAGTVAGRFVNTAGTACGVSVLVAGTTSEMSLFALLVKAAGASRSVLADVRLAAGCAAFGALVLPVDIMFAAVASVFALVLLLAVVNAAGAGTKLGGSGSIRFGSGVGSCSEALVGNW